MGLHRLPWPARELEQLGQQSPEADVELRVTLSYFIEPNPGERGWTKRHQYASHGLRFEVRHAGKFHRFRSGSIKRGTYRNRRGEVCGADKGWVLGSTLRNKGSIYCDVWRGPAARLVDRDAIAVYPVGGWWKEQQASRWQDRVIRYALIVTLRVPTGTDIYTPIAAATRVPTSVAIRSRRQ